VIRRPNSGLFAHDAGSSDNIRENANLVELLTRLDLAIAKARTEGIRIDELNPINQQSFPKR
jgi:hypothetical protein